MEHETLPAYSGNNPTCKKCGHVGASTTYLLIGTCMHNTGRSVPPLGVETNERLHRSCNNCDFEWDEAVVNAR